MYTLGELRSELRKAGYRLRTRRYSEFIGADILSPEGDEIMTVDTPERHVERLARHAPALAIRDKYKGKTFDGEFRVVIS